MAEVIKLNVEVEINNWESDKSCVMLSKGFS